MNINEKYISQLVMSVICELGNANNDLCSIDYNDSTRNPPTVEQCTAVRLSALREILDDIFKS